ncbi:MULTISPECIES: hypothetical protein [Bacillus amyloliquefaciens group]|uniref:hypothetical protein n=1 Tax=Bacillus TaxID=1386 RepID=UPI0015C461C9|nr:MULTISPECIES: hypothetical protein [Bacillus amyloliquefaciens group]MBU0443848.1 hypothetical protein [Bacillus amyloliquefaciens]MDH3100003.1 hypothetical protein [Bacillus velezensis]QLG06694.1 hypothetical protein GJS30_06335 [Bacillus velezensis]WGE01026.1 hypothetical protein P5644_05615 [Bacillus velezensis]WRT05827.1 hypothetical protein VO177_20080 [Bacillus velezensis]
MEQYTKERYTNMMKIPMSMEGSNKALYHYRKPTVQNCKVTFADGSTYWEKMIFNDKFLSIKVEPNKLYLDEACTVLADVTRKQRIQKCKRMGLI